MFYFIFIGQFSANVRNNCKLANICFVIFYKINRQTDFFQSAYLYGIINN